MNEQQAKQQAAQQIGQPTVGRLYRSAEPRELRIEQLDGGFVVMTANCGLGQYARRVIPNADSLLSFVQKWTTEGEAESRALATAQEALANP